MDGGSSYGIGNTLNVVGVATTSGFVQAVVEVEKIYNNVGDVVKISGVSSESYAGYNQLYRITGVDVGVARSVTVASASAVSGFATIGVSSEAQIPVGVGYTLTADAYMQVTGESVPISAISYDFNSGIATITSSGNHGLSVDESVEFVGASQAQYNGNFVVTQNNSLTQFAVNMGTGTTLSLIHISEPTRPY